MKTVSSERWQSLRRMALIRICYEHRTKDPFRATFWKALYRPKLWTIAVSGCSVVGTSTFTQYLEEFVRSRSKDDSRRCYYHESAPVQSALPSGGYRR